VRGPTIGGQVKSSSAWAIANSGCRARAMCHLAQQPLLRAASQHRVPGGRPHFSHPRRERTPAPNGIQLLAELQRQREATYKATSIPHGFLFSVPPDAAIEAESLAIDCPRIHPTHRSQGRPEQRRGTRAESGSVRVAASVGFHVRWGCRSLHVTPCVSISNGSSPASLRSHQSTVACNRAR
jgi:hypothetical protein